MTEEKRHDNIKVHRQNGGTEIGSLIGRKISGKEKKLLTNRVAHDIISELRPREGAASPVKRRKEP